MQVCIVIPVYNEEKILLQNVTTLRRFLSQDPGEHHCGQALDYTIIITDNGSTDRTLQIAQGLASSNSNIQVLHLDQKGRGRALKTAWLSSRADILAYMDADLSTDLNAYPSLIAPILRGEYDLVIGSRLLSPPSTTRCFKRELLSRAYSFLFRRLLHTRFRDAQCGFKAISRRAAMHVLPLVENTNWFFDTELLVLAERLGCRIFELPIRWTENRDTHVKIIETIAEDLRGLLRLWRRLRHERLHCIAHPDFRDPLPQSLLLK